MIFNVITNMKNIHYFLFLLLLMGCAIRESQNMQATEQEAQTSAYAKGTFGYDLNFLREYHNDVLLLHDRDHKAQLIVSPSYQGRV